ncbi:hypothetical protein [Chitinophaga tropicalis]|uniref:Uncharacterized protein n=1 Tax=Chitinophaga tropicalis TaxID=2683588 RepID=A0A7K1U7E5_9BACT|nr:hypothetical protein [Chitinophaga tropicalis]MVT10284.1 hypothetical protein [Chitinophaga tropicalis]
MLPNGMVLKGGHLSSLNRNLEIDLAPDHAEVRGFGQPITQQAASVMVDDYVNDIKKANDLLLKIEGDITLKDIAADQGFGIIKDLLSLTTQTVSGVFGKEIILQILAQRNCEGIRYAVGKSNGKNTLILVGVTEDAEGIPREENGEMIPPSKAIVNKDFNELPALSRVNGNGATADGPPPESNISINYVMAEVHRGSLTIAQLEDLFGIVQPPSFVLFGSY